VVSVSTRRACEFCCATLASESCLPNAAQAAPLPHLPPDLWIILYNIEGQPQVGATPLLRDAAPLLPCRLQTARAFFFQRAGGRGQHGGLQSLARVVRPSKERG
jgi:hypothetical protein